MELWALVVLTAIALAVSIALLRPEGRIVPAAVAALPPSLLIALAAVGARYPVRAMPLRTARPLTIAVTHVGSALLVGGLWTRAWDSWLELVSDPLAMKPRGELGDLGWAGALLYLGAVAVHYLVAEMDAANAAREAALRYQVLAREAELTAYKAQIDPHFLFNSLNAIASLCGSRPGNARDMAQRLADFFRLSVRLGRRERIALREEIELAGTYLEIEKIRFGPRLRTGIDLDPGAAEAAVPPLLLQPLVENAVRHGISTVLEGGEIAISAALADGRVRIVVENPRDPDAAIAKGEGVGLANVRARVAAFYDGSAVMRTTGGEERFRVEIDIPRLAPEGGLP